MPLVSVVVAAFNAGRYIESAIHSACAQTLREIEIIVVDDASNDDTFERVERMAAHDSRIRIDRASENRGPAGTRNRALDLARGKWIALLDADDLYAPDRLERLVAEGDRQQADLVADDLIVFETDRGESATRFLDGRITSGPITLDRYLDETRMYGDGLPLGYLKPIVRRDRLNAAGLRYDERLRIGEDDDLVIRMLFEGFAYALVNVPGYGYRKHSASISHRLSAAHAQAMLEGSERLRIDVASRASPATDATLRLRSEALRDAVFFARLIDALKARDFVAAGAIAIRKPRVIALLREPARAVVGRLLGRGRRRLHGNADACAALAVMRAAADGRR